MDILQRIDKFYSNYKGEKQIIGKSYLGKNIYCFKVGKGSPILICQYAIHAREHITSLLCLEHIKHFEKHKKTGTVYFIPTINPDGIAIAQIKKPLYKANARGVDLNVNFDARWGKGAKNVFTAGQENYVGEHPFSEIESRLLRDFTIKIRESLAFMPYAPILFVSAKTGQRLNKIFETVIAVANENAKRVTTGMLNDVLSDAQTRVQPPTDRGKRLKIYYMTQSGIKPPTFVFFVNNAELFHFSYQRYLENQLREAFGFNGTPIKLVIRQKGDDKE